MVVFIHTVHKVSIKTAKKWRSPSPKPSADFKNTTSAKMHLQSIYTNWILYIIKTSNAYKACVLAQISDAVAGWYMMLIKWRDKKKKRRSISSVCSVECGGAQSSLQASGPLFALVFRIDHRRHGAFVDGIFPLKERRHEKGEWVERRFGRFGLAGAVSLPFSPKWHRWRQKRWKPRIQITHCRRPCFWGITLKPNNTLLKIKVRFLVF